MVSSFEQTGMDSTVTLPWIAVLLIFLAGALVGWFASGKASARVSVGVRPDLPGDLGRSGIRFQTTRTRTIVLKCQCGAIWHFREGSDPLPPGTEPIPAGDSYICKQCGRSIDLKQERQLEADALRDIGSSPR
jgi:hypothetical protein